ncbi:BlaI/MecI/CopY family transcriptional regulator [Kitasatospora sp. CM 4170]|uniref:BlaI/MecI/CopY family transcriptional regulator n=1 Tax=Kitasatospora aburaviensis TaxID=67265 RepID=A0ABW1F5U1_9ACTN|nr:BlaI/MecI/CopY family transcriptional regulator [Kitasatospora sp. CM 4170]WNM49271.1 BlaI/MecI/CopY family transcriptional regulator [Kitasatospora sp. CM 4170]
MVRDGRDARRPHGELVADVLAVLWAAGEPLTAQQVKTALDQGLARTTVATILARLHEKGTLTRTRPGRSFAYAPVEDAAGLAAGRMRRELEKEPQRDLVLKRFVSSLSVDDEDILRRLLLDTRTATDEASRTADSDGPEPEDDA